jgi:hypothetical protein
MNSIKLNLLYTAYFTDDVCDSIRTSKDNIFYDVWKEYRVFHSKIEPINSTNGIFIIREFRYMFDEIISNQLPKHAFSRFLETISIKINMVFI